MSDRILQLLLLNAVVGTLLALVVAALARPCRDRPQLLHRLWVVVLLKWLLPPVVSISLPWPGTADPVTTELPGIQMEECPRQIERFSDLDSDDETVSAPVAKATTWIDWSMLLVMGWLTGAALVWGRALLLLRGLVRQLRELPEDISLRPRLWRLAKRLGLRRIPGVWLVPGVVPPLVVVVGRWQGLIVPGRLWEQLNEEQRDALLLHELAHLRRGDGLVRWLELAVLGLYWWLPSAWWAAGALRAVEEQCCDALVVQSSPGDRAAYAEVLIETIAFLSGPVVALPRMASGAGPVRQLQRRISMILQPTEPSRPSRWGTVVLLSATLALLPLVPTVGQTPAPRPSEQPTTQAVDPIDRVIAQNRSCQVCHSPATPPAEKTDPQLHDRVVRLLGEVGQLRKRLADKEGELKSTLADFEKSTLKSPPATPNRPTPEKRLEGVEKQLEQLQQQLDRLIKELRPVKASTKSDPPSRISEVHSRTFHLSINWNEESQEPLYLYGTECDGETYRLLQRVEPGTTRVRRSVEREGVYHFLLSDQNWTRAPGLSIRQVQPTQSVRVLQPEDKTR